MFEISRVDRVGSGQELSSYHGSGRLRSFPDTTGRIGSGRVGLGRVGSGRVGSGLELSNISRVGSGLVESGRVRSFPDITSRVGSGRVGSGRVGSGRVGSGAF